MGVGAPELGSDGAVGLGLHVVESASIGAGCFCCRIDSGCSHAIAPWGAPLLWGLDRLRAPTVPAPPPPGSAISSRARLGGTLSVSWRSTPTPWIGLSSRRAGAGVVAGDGEGSPNLVGDGGGACRLLSPSLQPGGAVASGGGDPGLGIGAIVGPRGLRLLALTSLRIPAFLGSGAWGDCGADGFDGWGGGGGGVGEAGSVGAIDLSDREEPHGGDGPHCSGLSIPQRWQGGAAWPWQGDPLDDGGEGGRHGVCNDGWDGGAAAGIAARRSRFLALAISSSSRSGTNGVIGLAPSPPGSAVASLDLRSPACLAIMARSSACILSLLSLSSASRLSLLHADRPQLSIGWSSEPGGGSSCQLGWSSQPGLGREPLRLGGVVVVVVAPRGWIVLGVEGQARREREGGGEHAGPARPCLRPGATLISIGLAFIKTHPRPPPPPPPWQG